MADCRQSSRQHTFIKGLVEVFNALVVRDNLAARHALVDKLSRDRCLVPTNVLGAMEAV